MVPPRSGGCPPGGATGGITGGWVAVAVRWDARGVALRPLRDGGGGEDGQAAAKRGRTGRKPLGATAGGARGCAWDARGMCVGWVLPLSPKGVGLSETRLRENPRNT